MGWDGRKTWLAIFGAVFALLVSSPGGVWGAESQTPPAPAMPASWKVVSDLDVPPAQVAAIGQKLGAEIVSVRNTVYQVSGKRVQLNTMVVANAENAEKLMASLKKMKSEDALLRNKQVVYEFVGQNDVLPVIAEGRAHLKAARDRH